MDPFTKWITNVGKLLLLEFVIGVLFMPPFNIGLWSYAFGYQDWVYDIILPLPMPFHVTTIGTYISH